MYTYTVLSRIGPNLTNKFSVLYFNFGLIKFRHHLCISHVSPDDGLFRPKRVVSGIIETFVCAVVILPFYQLGKKLLD
jgi:hypothetical protein